MNPMDPIPNMGMCSVYRDVIVGAAHTITRLPGVLHKALCLPKVESLVNYPNIQTCYLSALSTSSYREDMVLLLTFNVSLTN